MNTERCGKSSVNCDCFRIETQPTTYIASCGVVVWFRFISFFFLRFIWCASLNHRSKRDKNWMQTTIYNSFSHFVRKFRCLHFEYAISLFSFESVLPLLFSPRCSIVLVFGTLNFYTHFILLIKCIYMLQCCTYLIVKWFLDTMHRYRVWNLFYVLTEWEIDLMEMWCTLQA